jgi:hypothetical protein
MRDRALFVRIVISPNRVYHISHPPGFGLEDAANARRITIRWAAHDVPKTPCVEKNVPVAEPKDSECIASIAKITGANTDVVLANQKDQTLSAKIALK